MSAPSWLSGILAVVMLAVSAYCAGRLLAAGAWRRESELDADGMHLLMGVAMAGALASPVAIVPAGVWETLFAAAAGWFSWQVIRIRRGRGAGRWRCPYPAPHLTESLAMVYMLAAARAATPAGKSAGEAMAGMGGSQGVTRLPALAVVLALFMVGYAAWLGDRLASIRGVAGSQPCAAPPRPGPRVLAPRAAMAYKITMALTMAYMLINMV